MSARFLTDDMAETKVVILAAGKGKRMGAEVPKPLVEIAGKPMILQLLDRVNKAGIDEKPIVIVSPDGKQLFVDALGDRVLYAVQPEQLGTGDALKYAEEACNGAKRVMVLYGDHPFISPKALATLTDLSRENPEALVMLTTEVPNFDNEFAGFMAWSRILRDATGKIVGDRQYKDASATELAIKELNPCIYVFPAPWVWENLPKLTSNNAAKEFYLTDLVTIAMNEGKRIVSARVPPLEVVGVNTPEELRRAEELLQKTL